MKTQGEQVDCVARSGLYYSRPASAYKLYKRINELNTNRPKLTDKAQIKTPKTHTTQTNISKQSIIKINTFN